MEVIFIIIVAVSYIISMRRFILSENGLELIKGKILRESYSDKIDLVKRFLDKNFMRASAQKDGKDVGIFVKLNGNIPTDESLWKQDVLDILDDEFNNIISDKKERDGFLSQLVDDWYNKKITKYGSLSRYNFK
mgnify:FL=1